MMIIALFIFTFTFSYGQLTNLDSRCLWILRDSMTSKTAIDNAMTYAFKYGFDKVFIQIRGRGYAFYNSKIVPKNPVIVNINFDPLKYAIQLGKIFDIEVHAWFNTYILWSSTYEPKDSNHLFHTNKNWTETNMYGKMDYTIDLKSPKVPNWEGIYLSPLHPEVNQYLYSIIKEILDNYKVDGIHFDYIRYQDDIYGYNEVVRTIFEDIYSIDPMNIAKGIISTRFGWSPEFVDSIEATWEKYKQNAITELLEMVRTNINNLNRDIQLSAAVKPNLIIAKRKFSQDWKYWLESELLDFVVPMNYYANVDDFKNDINIMKNKLSKELRDSIVMGIATYNQNSEQASDKILITRLNGFSGISIFSYNAHENNLDWFLPLIDAMEYPFIK